jgi:PleD family two-component response regulator
VQAEYIRAAFKSMDFGTGDTITVSSGIAEMAEGEGVKDVISRADEALYTGKNNGRDQVCVATSRPEPTQGAAQTPATRS